MFSSWSLVALLDDAVGITTMSALLSDRRVVYGLSCLGTLYGGVELRSHRSLVSRDVGHRNSWDGETAPLGHPVGKRAPHRIKERAPVQSESP